MTSLTAREGVGHLRETFESMLDDLATYRLEVVLVPSLRREEARRGAMIRRVFSRNPSWYRKLCTKYPSGRQRRNNLLDTRIRRQHVVRALERMAETGVCSASPYANDLINIATNYATQPTLADVPF